MLPAFEQTLQKYAELIVKVGLNLQPGQRLLIGNARNFGVSFVAAPLVHQVVKAAYKAGAKFVDVIWGDEQLQLSRFQEAAPDSFTEYPIWQANAIAEYAKNGDALLTIYANDPDLLKGQNPDLVAIVQQTINRHRQPYSGYIMRNAINWSIAAASAPSWASKIFSGGSPEEHVDKLWSAILTACRVDQPDPVAAWQQHAANLASRSAYLNQKQYSALHYTGPGTNLTVGLPTGHLWKGGRNQSEAGIGFVPNLPTEEIFTLPHRDQTEGVVTASLPLSYGGVLIKNFSLTFAQGKVVKVNAEQGETVLSKLIDTDEGAGRLGEVALVPHSSPIAQSGLLFYNTLFDENAASHLALGSAYRFTIQGGEAMTTEEFEAVGGNQSIVHADFMIGSGAMNIDGITASGAREAVMRDGEWAF